MKRLALFTATWSAPGEGIVRASKTTLRDDPLNEALDYAGSLLDTFFVDYRYRRWVTFEWEDVRQKALTRVWTKWHLMDAARGHWKPFVKTLLNNALRNAVRDDTPRHPDIRERRRRWRFINPIRLGYRQLVDVNQTYLIESLSGVLETFRAGLNREDRSLFDRYLKSRTITEMAGSKRKPGPYRGGKPPSEVYTHVYCCKKVLDFKRRFRETLLQST